MKWLALLMIVSTAHAQELVPATSEDIQAFDRQIRAQQKTDRGGFGAQVREEARKLNDSSDDKNRDFGKWVSDQRKKSDQGVPSAGGSVGNGNGSGKGNSGSANSGPGNNSGRGNGAANGNGKGKSKGK